MTGGAGRGAGEVKGGSVRGFSCTLMARTHALQVHNDWFDPADPFYHDRVRIRGQRLVSVFCYLCDVPEGGGGGTFFPALNLRFLPRTGCAGGTGHTTPKSWISASHTAARSRPKGRESGA